MLFRSGAQHLFRVGGALVTVAPGSVSLQRNRVLGLGVGEPAAAPMIDQIVDIFRAFKVQRFSFHQNPGPQFDAIGGWLRARGLKLHHGYSRLLRHTRPGPPVPGEVRVRRIGKADAAAFAGVFGGVSPMPPAQLEWIAASVGAPGFNHYLAFRGERPVATGLVYVEGDYAWMGWGGTLTPFRRQGAHSALVAARVDRARELGAKWITSSTLEPQRGRPAGSYRNLLKYGFEELGVRPIWAWEQERGRR